MTCGCSILATPTGQRRCDPEVAGLGDAPCGPGQRCDEGRCVPDTCEEGRPEICDGDDDDCDLAVDEGAAPNPEREERCDGVDNDCDGFVDEGAAPSAERSESCDGLDNDCDGAIDEGAPADPSREEICGEDQDCDGRIGEGASPTAELCDGADNDCDGVVDETPGPDDAPWEERCNGTDDDCDGRCDEGHDADGDTFTSCGTVASQGSAGCGLTSNAQDCNDGDPLIFPGATERCDQIDHDCDGRAVPADLDARDSLCMDGRICEPAAAVGCVPDDCFAPRNACSEPAPLCDPATRSCIRAECSPAECAPSGAFCDAISGACQPDRPTGTVCNSNDECQTDWCGPRVTLGLDGVGSICMRPCCSDAQCGPDEYCFAAPSGARSCLPFGPYDAETGRGTPGPLERGAACAASSQCQSGLCAQGRCTRACSIAADCPTGNCGPVARVGMVCGVGGGVGDACGEDARCAVPGCADNQCQSEACVERSSCASRGDLLAYCDYAAAGEALVPRCAYADAVGEPFGAECDRDLCSPLAALVFGCQGCRTGICLSGRCSRPCCNDAQCGAGARCRPVRQSVGFDAYPMHCVAED